MNETDNGSFVVELKEWKLFNYKTHFSFVSRSDLKRAITETLDKVYEHFLNDTKYTFSMENKNKKLFDLLNFIELYKLG